MDFLFNPIPFIATTLALILTVCIIKIVAGRLGEKRKRYHPVAGTVFHQLLNFQRLHHYLTDLGTKYKTYRLLNPSRGKVYTTDPANVEYILKTNFANYGKGLYHYSNLKDLLGDGIFAVDGEKWQHQRKESSYEFSTKILRDFSSAIFKSNAAKLAQAVSQAVTSKQDIEMQDLFMKSTLQSVFNIVLGVELDTMSGTYKEGTRFIKAFDESSAMTMYRYVDIFWKIKRFLNIGKEAILRDSIKFVHEYMYKIIRIKMEQVHELRDDMPMKKGDILSRFLELEETDPNYLKDIILSFMIAAKDTTAGTLSWFFYFLCKHPLIQEKIAQEVREATKLKDNSSIDEVAASLTEEALDKMQYLHAALTETLRLYPAVPLNGKICFSDDTLPDGFSVRKGDLVSYHSYGMGRMKFLWGDDAEDFRPERWLDENGNFRQASPYKFPAFQAGPRICLGKEFAYRQMKIFSAVLLGGFMFKLRDENKRVKYRTMLTMHIDGGLHLRASQRLWQNSPIIA